MVTDVNIVKTESSTNLESLLKTLIKKNKIHYKQPQIWLLTLCIKATAAGRFNKQDI